MSGRISFGSPLTRFRLALLNFQFVLKPKDLEYLESPLATNPKIHRAKKVNKKPERYFQNHPIWDSNEDPCRVKQTRTESRLTIKVALFFEKKVYTRCFVYFGFISSIRLVKLVFLSMLAKIVSNQNKVYYSIIYSILISLLLKIINILFINDVFLYRLNIVTKNRLYINFQMISDGTVAIIQRKLHEVMILWEKKIEKNKILLFF